jgi:hypothetical protein
MTTACAVSLSTSTPPQNTLMSMPPASKGVRISNPAQISFTLALKAFLKQSPHENSTAMGRPQGSQWSARILAIGCPHWYFTESEKSCILHAPLVDTSWTPR